MKAMHRGKDNDGNTLGLMIDGRFIASSLVKDNTPDIENLTVQKTEPSERKESCRSCIIKDAVIKAAYKDLIQENPFERNIQSELEHWRSTRYGQIGKTTELLKFAYKNYIQ